MLTRQAGTWRHIDCRNLPPNLIAGDPTRYALVIVIDAETRLAWGQDVVHERTSLIVTCSALMSILVLGRRYRLQFEEVLTDRGAKFAKPTQPAVHPFECMLLESGIGHRYTRPYRPQTNGKVERFWRTVTETTHMVRQTDLFITAWDDRRVIGCGRVLTDYVYRASIWDVIVDSAYQGQDVGTEIIHRILKPSGPPTRRTLLALYP